VGARACNVNAWYQMNKQREQQNKVFVAPVGRNCMDDRCSIFDTHTGLVQGPVKVRHQISRGTLKVKKRTDGSAIGWGRFRRDS